MGHEAKDRLGLVEFNALEAEPQKKYRSAFERRPSQSTTFPINHLPNEAVQDDYVEPCCKQILEKLKTKQAVDDTFDDRVREFGQILTLVKRTGSVSSML